MYLLDTNVVSELRKPKPHGAVLAWFEALADEQLHVSAVTIGEIQVGIELTREQDEAFGHHRHERAEKGQAALTPGHSRCNR